MRNNKWIYGFPVLMGIAAIPAHAAVTIIPSYSSDYTASEQAAINSAINVYATDFTNNNTVYINFANMNSGLGQSVTPYASVSYSDYRTALLNTVTNPTVNAEIQAALPITGNPVPGNGPNASNNSPDGSNVSATVADLRTLGFSGYDSSSTSADSTISINLGQTFTGPATAADSQFYDLSSVASHEIDEALGLSSALDDLAQDAAAPINTTGSLDFFRYSAPGVRSFDTSASTTSYLSTDLGATSVVGFNQDASGDFHDWYSVNGVTTPRVQDAIGSPGVNIALGPAEFTALNLVGYNFASPAPEPSSMADLALIAFALGGFLWTARKRKIAADAG